MGFAGGAAEEAIWAYSGSGHSDMMIGYVLGALMGWLIWRPIYTKWMVHRFRKRFAALGHPLEMPLSLRVDSDALVYRLGAVEQRAGWSGVTEVFRVPGYWVFVVQGANYWTPRRFFPDPAAERAFVAEALSHMSEAARKRSAKAEAFVRKGAA